MGSKTKTTPGAQGAKTTASHKPAYIKYRVPLVIFGVALLLVASVIGGVLWYYQDRALPNVVLANVSVDGKSKEEIKAIAQAHKEAITLAFDNNGQKTEVSLADVGVIIDIDKTVDQAINARRNWLDLVLFWQPAEVPLSYVSDLGVAKAFAKEHFPDVVTDAKDAQVVFNNQSNSFEVKPGEPGKGFDALSFVHVVEQLVYDPKPITLPLTTAPVHPVIQAEKLEPIKEQTNKITTLAIKFWHKGNHVYTAEPAEIASWAHFVAEPAKSSVAVSYDAAKIEQFLKQKVGASIAATPVDRKIIVDSSGREIVIQSGREGRQLEDIEGLTKEVLSAVENNVALEKDVSVTTAPFKTVTMTAADRWIEVDLSEQRTNLYLGAERIASYLISSGKAKTPTVTGEFAITWQTPMRTMTGTIAGDSYYVPDIPWVSYFHQGYAFHHAYWHNNFGQPMSHGCINMRYDDAKTLYDFAPPGTPVIVHK